ncbi:MAG: hypothetical protein KKH98_01590 [Spirochaetes bacterium]|nr:hypothetical protein [Spirochaetota bacterium]
MKLKEQTSQLNEQLKKIQNILTKKLSYITNEEQVDQSMIGDIRPKLIQLKNLNQSSDITVNPEESVNKLVDFFSNRILISKVAITGKIFPHKKK